MQMIPTGSGWPIKVLSTNEMKGAMSSPDQVMVRSIQKELYPSTTYHYNSGGDPAENSIIDLRATQRIPSALLSPQQCVFLYLR